MLKKKIVDFRVDISETSPEEFENLRRCQNYCHLVEKNLIPEYKFDEKGKKAVTKEGGKLTRAATARSARTQSPANLTCQSSRRKHTERS